MWGAGLFHQKIDPKNQSLPLSLLINNVNTNFFNSTKKETLKRNKGNHFI